MQPRAQRERPAGGAGATPRPGTPVRDSASGRPVMALLDLLGRRWTLRVLWELRDDEVPTFRELQARCGGMSSSVLSQRLSELREAGIVEPERLTVTQDGRELLQALTPVHEWAAKWARRSTSKRVHA